MIETPLGVLLTMFQEDRYFWAVADDRLQIIECRFCDCKGSRPENLVHSDGCVIELAARMIKSDEEFVRRMKAGPKRRVFRGTARLTVWRKVGGRYWKDDR